MIAHLIPLAETSDELESVRPGWIPLIIVLLLGAFIAFLYFSMRKQLGKIDIPDDGAAAESENGNGVPPEGPA